MRLTKKDQFDLIDQFNSSELEKRFSPSNLKDVFNITEDEYCEWDYFRAIDSSVYRQKETYDGIYFIESNGEWEVFWKERGGYCFGQHLKTKNYKKARNYLSKLTMPYYIAVRKK
ncbi:hypothetical protein NO559_11375 [Dasania sp. GY-MA-18]|uniref:Uncharacterized protein n=1 Tax=Dasania phycosphaerae TaxID=2950436 RepID=A0A9J6RMR0_9GAMM|nr:MULTISPECIES: hypothetical protein [Dasania]MCR8923379.1 hypothetical protein [Dasania sp. GY-MA-18]MCZ0865811.1 hypothetical protein [Dasania phycosphaerae]MCZ0869536.1 hypothetical protein [Dasania phycosphaerae]